MERERDEDHKTDAEPKEPPVDGPGTGSDDEGLGDTSQDSPGSD